MSLTDQNDKDEYIIKYILIVSEPEYINLEDYITDIDYNYGDINEDSYYNPEEYIGKTSYLKIVKNGFLTKNC